MGWPDMSVGEGVNKNTQIQENRLVLSIGQNGKIVFFNKECEKIAGYSKNEVLDRRILDFLIPEHHRNQWEKIFDFAIQNQSINSFKLPWLTRNGQEIMATWTVAPVSDSNDRVGDLGLVGEIIPVVDDESYLSENVKNPRELENKPDDVIESKVKERKDNFVLFQLKDKKLVFKKPPSSSKSKDVLDETKDKNYSKPDKLMFETAKNDEVTKKDYIIEKMKTSGVETKIKEKETSKDPKNIFDKYDHDNLVKNYKTYNKTVQSLEELKERNNELEEENKNLKVSLKSVKIKLASNKKKLENLENHGTLVKKTTELFRNSVYFIFDVVGGKKKKEEFDSMIHKLDERRTVLNDLESQLNKDKKDLNKSRNDFVEWRENLELLEREIEKRNEDIAKKEEKVRKNLLFFMDEGVQDEAEVLKEEVPLSSEIDKDVELEHHELLDKIPQSAAIVQRGILKQVNDPFVDLLGYDVEMLVEKNLFDFVVTEGFSGIEKYYLKRLKGENVTSYETVFHTKQDDKIAVEVSTKPINFNGEKAEIAVFKKLIDEQEGAVTISSDKAEEKSEVTEEVSWGRKSQTEINDIVKKMRARNEAEVSADGEVAGKLEEAAVVDEVSYRPEDGSASDDVADESEKISGDVDAKSEEAASAESKMNQAEIDAIVKKKKEKKD